ncbi:ATP-binding protein [Desulfobotulus sp. H1]|uniref:histidine kinase n=1 Tax=Desulfobotulus pelophilus TaxID=2823377 RepID=A0ABT3N9R9_9BACT|nr:ATP-binding protein [Desulfobotulus pelophilus]MCW7754199.1 ATP-binding protein [Desulfobotulus pelophilus]
MQVHEKELVNKLSWLVSVRIFLALILLAFSFFFDHQPVAAFDTFPADILYIIATLALFLCLLYALWQRIVRKPIYFAMVQLSMDSFLVTLLIWATGGFDSPLTFLYMIVIINAGILISRRGSLFIAAISAIFFGLLVDFEYYGVLPDLGDGRVPLADTVDFWSVFFRILATTIACFSVSLLTSFLSVQLRKARDEVRYMGSYVKRMENLATVGEMAAGLAHEIKNPLASLRGAVELLEAEAGRDEDSRRLMRIVRRESDRLSALLTDFLFFARPGKGCPEPVNVAAMVRESVQIQNQSARNRGRITFRFCLTEDVWVRADPDRLRQVVWNLLLNAAESIEGEGEVRIDLGIEKERIAHIRIADTGCGIPEDSIPSIFDPFYTTKPGGTGLGLSIALRIVDAMGGRLDVDSIPDKGSTFTLRLPRLNPSDSL